jgi:hypothetical protein
LFQDEQELLRIIAEDEKGLNKDKNEFDELCKIIKADSKDVRSLKEKLKQAEEEIFIKDSEYDKQLSSGNQLDNLPVKHAQKVQELENLQVLYNQSFKIKQNKTYRSV